MNIIELLTALSPVVLTAVATYILIKQYSLDKKKFRLEHFDSRYQIYVRTMDYLSSIVANATTTANEMLDFRKETSDVIIFFNDEIQTYVEEIYKKANSLRYCTTMTKNGNLEHDKQVKFASDEFELMTWFGNQFSICENLFVKYLKID